MGMGGMALGAGAGLLGGALIADSINDHEQEAYQDGYRKLLYSAPINKDCTNNSQRTVKITTTVATTAVVILMVEVTSKCWLCTSVDVGFLLVCCYCFILLLLSLVLGFTSNISF